MPPRRRGKSKAPREPASDDDEAPTTTRSGSSSSSFSSLLARLALAGFAVYTLFWLLLLPDTLGNTGGPLPLAQPNAFERVQTLVIGHEAVGCWMGLDSGLPGALPALARQLLRLELITGLRFAANDGRNLLGQSGACTHAAVEAAAAAGSGGSEEATCVFAVVFRRAQLGALQECRLQVESGLDMKLLGPMRSGKAEATVALGAHHGYELRKLSIVLSPSAYFNDATVAAAELEQCDERRFSQLPARDNHTGNRASCDRSLEEGCEHIRIEVTPGEGRTAVHGDEGDETQQVFYYADASAGRTTDSSAQDCVAWTSPVEKACIERGFGSCAAEQKKSCEDRELQAAQDAERRNTKEEEAAAASRQAQARAVEAAAAERRRMQPLKSFTVVLPAGAKAGLELTAKTPDGQSKKVVLPAGSAPGLELTIRYVPLGASRNGTA